MKRRNRQSSSARSPEPHRADVSTARPFGPKDWFFVVALLVAVILAYQPAWQGGFIWDDNAHITAPGLRSWHGLYRIWFDVRATQQYYPLTETGFWVQYKLWGNAVLGYHLVNILLHALASVMVALVLRQLAIPGALLAAAIFALHPINVETVAWITEQKNTLSAVFYLGAAMAYFRFDQNRGASWYLAALVLFVLSLASKIVAVTLPAALLVIFWWQRGRLSWRRDVLPLLPFFAIGVVAGVFVSWVERKLTGAEGPDFELSILQRCLLPGRVIWFYLGKLCWPADLHFIYPRWEINPGVWWQYVFPLALLMLVGVLWWLSRWWRGPLAGLLFFAGTLFPVLGFLNVLWFCLSYVADHFPYLANLGIIALVAAGATLLSARGGQWRRLAGYAFSLGLLTVLAALTWRQSQMYTDLETLCRTTIERTPACWVAHKNLGLILAERGQVDEAIVQYRKAVEIKPDYAEAHYSLGVVLARRGQVDEAIAQYQKAVEIKPDYAEALNNLGLALAQCGRLNEAIAEYQKAVEINPDYAEALDNLGNALAGCGRIEEAIASYQKAVEVNPDYAEAYSNLGLALAGRGRVEEAIANYRKALESKPDSAAVHNNLGLALAGRGEIDEALGHYRQALALEPKYAEAHNNLANALANRGQIDEAMVHYRKALEAKPDYAGARRNLEIVQSRWEEIRKAPAGWRESLRAAR